MPMSYFNEHALGMAIMELLNIGETDKIKPY